MTYNNRNAANIQYFKNCEFGQYNHDNQYNKDNNTYNCYNNNNSRKLLRRKCYICGKKGHCSNKHLEDEQRKAKEL